MDSFVLIVPSSVVILGVVIFGAKFLLSRGEASKRRKEAAVGRFDQLTASKTHSDSQTWNSQRSCETLMGEANAWFSGQAGRVASQDSGQFIGFLGDAGKVKFEGMFQASPEAMPVRVAIRLQPDGESSIVQLQVDEDFGFQMFMGPIKKAFVEKYEARTTQINDELRKLLV
jgi:hypothetical protein